MSSDMLAILIVVFVQTLSVDGQSTIGYSEVVGLNLLDEKQNMILDEIRHLQNRGSVCSNNSYCPKTEDILFRHLNNMTETFQSFSSRFEVLDQNVQKGRVSLEDLQLKLSNSQIEDLLSQHLNNVTQTFQSLSSRFEVLDQNVQKGGVSLEDLRLKLSSSQFEDILSQYLNNVTQTFQSFSSRFEVLDQNVQKGGASLEDLQLKLSSSQIEDLLSQHLNNVTQTFQSLSNRLETIEQKNQIGWKFVEGLQMNFQNLSKLYEEQAKILGSVDRKLEEHDQYYRNQSAASTSSDNDGRDSRPWSRDCAEIRKMGQSSSGVYQVSSLGPDLLPTEISVYCDMSSSSVDSWLVFQRRKDGSENFERTWIEYRNGFGNLREEFWLGNNALHVLTSNRNYKLRIEMEDFDQDKRFAEYTHFAVGPAADNYRLNISGYSGDAGDSMAHHNGKMFSTKDADHDAHSDQHCAQVYHGAWWHHTCHHANLNGLYLRGNHTSFADGIEWYAFRGYHHSLKIVEMKIAPRN